MVTSWHQPRTPRRLRAADRPPEEPGLPADEAVSVNAPVVGIGCSAGGLEAPTSLLGAVPADTRLSFALSSCSTGIRATPARCRRCHASPCGALGRPPARCWSRGVCNVAPLIATCRSTAPRSGLAEIEPGSSLRLPVDALFRSLADGMRQPGHRRGAVGMGSDGTRGLLAIKERGG